jgi:hypothetical protein
MDMKAYIVALMVLGILGLASAASIESENVLNVIGSATTCSSDGECADSSICTIDKCVSQTCQYLNIDLDGSGKIGMGDIMRITPLWTVGVGEPGYDPAKDLDGSGKIGMGDIMRITPLWTQSCPPSICGNNVIDGSEDCDGGDLNSQTCEDLGYDGGTLACTGTCQFDESGCYYEGVFTEVMDKNDIDTLSVAEDYLFDISTSMCGGDPMNCMGRRVEIRNGPYAGWYTIREWARCNTDVPGSCSVGEIFLGPRGPPRDTSDEPPMPIPDYWARPILGQDFIDYGREEISWNYRLYGHSSCDGDWDSDDECDGATQAEGNSHCSGGGGVCDLNTCSCVAKGSCNHVWEVGDPPAGLECDGATQAEGDSHCAADQLCNLGTCMCGDACNGVWNRDDTTAGTYCDGATQAQGDSHCAAGQLCNLETCNCLTLDLPYSLGVYNDGAGDKLYVGTGDSGLIYVYDGTSWSLAYDSPGGYILDLEVYNGRLYALVDEAIYVYDGTSWGPAYETGQEDVWSMAVYSNKLYVGTSNEGKIYVYDGTWREAYDSPEIIISSLGVYNNKLYAGTGPLGKIYVYDGTWREAYDPPEVAVSSLAVFNNKLYAGVYPSGDIYAYNGNTWSLSFDSLETHIQSMAVYNNKLYAGTYNEGRVFVYDGTSWSVAYGPTDDSIDSMTVFNNKLYAATGDNGRIYVYDGANWAVAYGPPASADIEPPYVSDTTPNEDEKDVSIGTNVVAIIRDAATGVDTSSIRMSVDGPDVTSSLVITGTPAGYTATYDPPQDFAYAKKCLVIIEAQDLADPPNVMSTYFYFTTRASQDFVSPSITLVSPETPTDIPVDTNFVFLVRDYSVDGSAISGVDTSSISLILGFDNDVSSDLVITPTGQPYEYRVTYNPPVNFGYGEEVWVSFYVPDLASPLNFNRYIFPFTIVSG